MSYTYYDYLDLPPGATPGADRSRVSESARTLSTTAATDTGQDMSGLVAMVHSAYEVLVESRGARSLRRDAGARSRHGRRRAQGHARPARNRRTASPAARAGFAARRVRGHRGLTRLRAHDLTAVRDFTAYSDAIGDRSFPQAHVRGGTRRAAVVDAHERAAEPLSCRTPPATSGRSPRAWRRASARPQCRRGRSSRACGRCA